MVRRAFLLIVGLSFLVGASAVPAQENGAECGGAFASIVGELTTAFQAAAQDASGGTGSVFLRHSIPLSASLSLSLGVSADAFKIAENASPAPQVRVFYIGTEAADPNASAASRLTLQIPQAAVTATASGASNLRTGPDTRYDVFGRTTAGENLNVLAAISRGGFDWLNVQTPSGVAWLRSDQARISDAAALVGLQPQFTFGFNDLLTYADSERTVGCPLPSALLVQTPPNTTFAYDVNGMRLLQSGTAIITLENFAPAAGAANLARKRIYFTNVQGTLETIAPLLPFQMTDPDRTFAVEFNDDGTPLGYTGSFTQAEQELTSAALRFTCYAANLYNQALTSANGTGFLYADAPCTGTFASLHPGWSAVLEAWQTPPATIASATETVDVEAAIALATAEPQADVPPVTETVLVTDADIDPVDCGTFRPATGSVIYWNLKALSAEPVAEGVRLTATLEGGENIPIARYVFFRVQIGDEPQKLYAVDLEGSTIIGAGERNQAFQLIPGTEGTMQSEPPNRVSLLINADQFRVFVASGVVGSACDKLPDESVESDTSTWLSYGGGS